MARSTRAAAKPKDNRAGSGKGRQPARKIAKQSLNEAQIAVHWREEGAVRPPASFVAQANLVDRKIVKSFGEENFPKCFDQYADLLTWDKRWRKTLDTAKPPFWKWFVGGKLNASYNCVDRHLAEHKNKAATSGGNKHKDKIHPIFSNNANPGREVWRAGDFSGPRFFL